MGGTLERHPFSGLVHSAVDPSGLTRWKASSDPPTPRSWIPIDVALERIVVKAMARARRERYGSARELAAELADPAAAMEASLEPSRRAGCGSTGGQGGNALR